MSQPVLAFENVSFSYQNKINVLENVDLKVEKGEFLGIIGPNGSGKSTLLKLALGLLKPSQGLIRVFGQTPVKARSQIGYVPQFAKFSKNFPISVMQTVLMGRLTATSFFPFYSSQDFAVARQCLEQVRLMHLADRPIGDLSGGELERVLIARALASEPELLVLDEPTASVDPGVEESIFELLKRINKTVTLIVVSHDVGFIHHYVTHVACLNKTMVCHPKSELTADMLQKLYGNSAQMVDHFHHAHLHYHSDSDSGSGGGHP